MPALTDCITRCAIADDAEILVAEGRGEVVGYLHYDCEGVEPELHRIYVDPGQKRGGVGSAFMRELHARLPSSGQYVLLVAELNKDAHAFYERHGLVVESRVDGPSYYSETMAIETDEAPQAAAILMRYRPAAQKCQLHLKERFHARLDGSPTVAHALRGTCPRGRTGGVVVQPIESCSA